MRIYFDENFSHNLVNGLRELQKGSPCDGVEVCFIPDAFGKGAKDEEWIPEIAKQGGIVITQDLNIDRVRAQRLLCERCGIGIIFFKPPKKGWNYWGIVTLVLKHWQAIKEVVLKKRKPFAYLVEFHAIKLKKC